MLIYMNKNLFSCAFVFLKPSYESKFKYLYVLLKFGQKNGSLSSSVKKNTRSYLW